MRDPINDSSGGDAKAQALRAELEQTRAALAQKIARLQSRMTGQVDEVKSSAQECARTTKETLMSAAKSLQIAFAMRHLVSRNPWYMVGSMLWVGAELARRRLTRSADEGQQATSAANDETTKLDETRKSIESPQTVEATAVETGARAKLSRARRWVLTRFQQELAGLKKAAMASGMVMARDCIKRALPGDESDSKPGATPKP